MKIEIDLNNDKDIDKLIKMLVTIQAVKGL